MKQEENRPMDKLKSDYESIPVPTEAKERMLAGIAQAKKEQKGVIIMKFAKKAQINSTYLDFSNYEFDPNRSLGVVFDMGNGTCDVVILNLSVTGGIGSDSENYPATQVYTGFGEVKDILFL